MAVQNDKNRIVYPGNGVQDTFDFDFYVADEPNELVVTRIDADNVEFKLLLDIDFAITVSSVDENGGTIQYPISGPPLPADQKIAIERLVTETQPKVLRNQGGFYLNSIEAALDRLTHLVQQLSDAIDRSVKFGVGSLQTGKVLPEPQAGAAIGWDNAANQLVNLFALSSSSTVTAFVDGLLDKANAADFLTGLGVSAFIQTLLDDVSAVTARTTLDAASLNADNLLKGRNAFNKALQLVQGSNLGNANVDATGLLTLTDDGGYYNYNGTDTVNQISSVGIGSFVVIRHGAASVFVHDGDFIRLPRAISRSSLSGDVSLWYEYLTGKWQCLHWSEHDASTTEKGIAELATNAEALAGVDAVRAVTPQGLGAAIAGVNPTYTFNVALANNTERQNTSGKAKVVIIRVAGVSEVDVSMGATSGALDVVGSSFGSVAQEHTITIFVPNNFFYKYNIVSGTVTITVTEVG